jgi:tetratricopeptide (TPR) repeat protein
MKAASFFRLNLLYRASLIFSLVILLIGAYNAPMSGDEYVHVQQAKKNIAYLESWGTDKDALDTPVSRLKHYGQSFDTITKYLVQLLYIQNEFRFRHLLNALMAWCIVLFTSLTAFHLTNSRASAIIAVLLMLATPRFTGHAMNNLKDIPFAFGFICSSYYLLRFLCKMPVFSIRYLTGIIFGMAFAISIRIGGVLIYCYVLLFVSLWFFYLHQTGTVRVHLQLIAKAMVLMVVVLIVSYSLGIMLWPWALESPIKNPLESLALMNHYPTSVRQIFEGRLYWSDEFPWYYLPKYLLITLPIILLAGLIAFLLLWLNDRKANLQALFLLITAGFPLFYAATTGANVYGGWRQVLFVLPPMAILASAGIWRVFTILKPYKWAFVIASGICAISCTYPVSYSLFQYPYQYIFFNIGQGGVKGAYGSFELDYYFTGFKEAYQWVDRQLEDQQAVVASNFIIPTYYEEKPYTPKLIDYYHRSAHDWDYAVICNTFLQPWQLKNNRWPPKNTIHEVRVSGVPIVAVLKRESKSDFRGIQLLKTGKARRAVIELNKALTNDPDNESILIYMAQAYASLEQYDSTQLALQKLFRIYPGNESGRDVQGQVFLKKAEFQSAEQVFSEIVADNTRFFHAYVGLAKAQRGLGKDDEAIASLKACLRINPYYETAYKLYGQMLIERGEAALGQKMLDFSIEGDSKYGIQ